MPIGAQSPPSWPQTLLGLGLALACAGCPPTASSAGYQHLNEEIEAQLADVGLGPGDVFEVRVYGETELSGVHRISPDGSIDFPLVGRVTIEGQTPDTIIP